MKRGWIALMLMCVSSLPASVRALGLGDIHVNSALNEPLSARIEILGATTGELQGLQVKVANRDMFKRIGADRPGFLSSTTFKVAADEQGRPVLNVRSSEPYTEPLVNLVIDVTWGSGELIREFSLLLDPAESTQARAAAAAAPAAVAETAPSVPAITPEAASDEKPAHPARPARYRVARGDTLRTLAIRAGARRASDAQRTMIAIFRLNPRAFDGNINRLRRGAQLDMPDAGMIAAISEIDAAREVQAQTAAWRHRIANVPAAPRPAAPRPAAPIELPANATPGQASATDSMKVRVRTLERALRDVNAQIAAKESAIRALQSQAAMPVIKSTVPAVVQAPATRTAALQQALAQPAATHRTQARAATAGHGGSKLVPVALGIALLIVCAVLFRRRPAAAAPQADAAAVPAAMTADVPQTAAPLAAPAAANVPPPSEPAAEPRSRMDSQETMMRNENATVMLEPSFEDSIVSDADTLEPDLKTMILDARKSFPPVIDATSLDYDLDSLDLDSTTQHVEMPSNLNDRPVVSERRTNIADALKSAIERDPTRQDLVMKLLETYYSEASLNRRAFLEVARKLARQPDSMPRADWEKIEAMGREIASDDILFAAEATAENVAIRTASGA